MDAYCEKPPTMCQVCIGFLWCGEFEGLCAKQPPSPKHYEQCQGLHGIDSNFVGNCNPSLGLVYETYNVIRPPHM